MSRQFREVITWLDNYKANGLHAGTSRCPAHPDQHNSLGIVERADGDAWLTCFAGCPYENIWAKLENRPPHETDAPPFRGNGKDYSQIALEIWDNAHAINPAGPVVLYLERRGISFKNISAYQLRETELRHPVTGDVYPAMIGGVTDVKGNTIAIHRTFLTLDGNKAPVSPVKMMLGKCRGGAIRFQFNSGPGDVVFLCEGIETALSFKQLFGEAILVYAGLSVTGMMGVEFNPRITKVVVVADGDELGSIAFLAAQRVVAKHSRLYETHLLRCHKVGKDFNDILRERRRED